MKGYTRPTVPADIPLVAANMRAADVAEIKAGSGRDPKDALLWSFMMGKPCMTLVSYTNAPMGMWGVIPDGKFPQAGRIWMLGTDELVQDSRNRVRFLKECKRELERMLTQYDVLWNYMDARNVVHKNWLEWMGFTFIAERPNYGTEGRLFLEFCKVSHV